MSATTDHVSYNRPCQLQQTMSATTDQVSYNRPYQLHQVLQQTMSTTINHVSYDMPSLSATSLIVKLRSVPTHLQFLCRGHDPVLSANGLSVEMKCHLKVTLLLTHSAKVVQHLMISKRNLLVTRTHNLIYILYRLYHVSYYFT